MQRERYRTRAQLPLENTSDRFPTMRGRLRYLIALAFVAMFVMVPAPDVRSGAPYMAYLQVREWLLAADSPLASWQARGRAPQLAVELRQSPPIEDQGELRTRTAEYARLATEWSLGPGRGGARPAEPAEPVGLPLTVLIGSDGVRASLPLPDGHLAVYERALPSRFSLLPALVAIVLAVLTQRVLLGLFCGCLAGALAYVATATPGALPGVGQIVTQGLWHFVGDAFWRRSVGEDFYLRITAFVTFLFMTIGVITHNGGMHGLVERLQRFVRGPASAQLATMLSGFAVFFDDYSNCLLVGTTMRPLTDRARVSREKLAYLVDSTAAPVAGLSVFSTWVVYEMSQYRAPLTMVTRPDGTPYAPNDTFAVFLDSLPFRFYSIFALTLVVLVVLLRRDFGPMLRAEQRARHEGLPLARTARPMAAVDERIATPAVGTPHRAVNALLPLVVLVFGTIGLMLWQGIAGAAASPAVADLGFGDWLREVLARTESDVALLYASAAAWLCAILLTLGQRLLSLGAILRTSLLATRALYVAFGILFLAWSLGHICRDLGTSFFLTATARHAMTAAALPLLLFVVAGAIAFATGTSFGTMAILLPNVVVLAHQLGTDTAFGGDAAMGGTALMLLAIGAVLEGAIFGDQCSPISDTTVLSSLGAQCDLLAHVTTQLPYALLAMATSVVCGYLPIMVLGPDVWPWSMAAGVLLLASTLWFCGRDASVPPVTTQRDAG